MTRIAAVDSRYQEAIGRGGRRPFLVLRGHLPAVVIAGSASSGFNMDAV